MTNGTWREDVAALLAEAARAIASRQDKRAVQTLGTAVGYLEKAHALGDLGAGQLLHQLRGNAVDSPTERFTFAPGELEEIKSRRSP